jgi:coenzyme F420-0:L-glutamate ligase/coenzyme F420-1:gamma-L-glutamate ligase
MVTMPEVRLIGLGGIPLVETGDDLPGLIADAIRSNHIQLQMGDVLVVTSKIVSKAEGRWVDLATVSPDAEALRVAGECGKDPREVALILSESSEISRIRQGVLIVRHRLGFVCANAGMDHSNTRPDGEWRLLLPENPDRSAEALRARLRAVYGVEIGVVISDSHGRPFRMGTVGVAVGAAGVPALWDLRGHPDLFGVALRVTDVGFADELAAAAGLVQGQADEAIPAVIIRGLSYPSEPQQTAANLNRPRELDLYR